MLMNLDQIVKYFFSLRVRQGSYLFLPISDLFVCSFVGGSSMDTVGIIPNSGLVFLRRRVVSEKDVSLNQFVNAVL